ncbi:sodium/glutamate symporter [Conservatibacter flavescens]|uniref:Sodium/glutamate symporter n=1 Tax=Conservatibacter flavescens TaxID=28161 RepID=A0A2M8S1B4_9PAST|nr:sodium/glutamate symporter [Conservatibacter flavescens]PJG84949.1 sodium/glutamate symporter [Conservatibacter flavescens]
MTITFDLLQTMGIAALVFFLGNYLKSKIQFLQTYFIPAPVIGGLICSLLIFFAHKMGVEMKFTMTLQDFFMNIFFTCTGFTCSLEVIKRSGKQGAILAIGAVTFLAVQNLIGIGLSEVMDIHPLLGIAMGSISMSGGIGSAAAFGPVLEQYGAVGGTTIGIAAATFGLLLGSLVGGPVAHRLITRYNLKSSAQISTQENNESFHELSEKKLFKGTLIIFLGSMIGVYIHELLLLTGLKFPYFVGCLFGGMLLRNLSDAGIGQLEHKEIDILGNISLNIFLSLALMSLNISKLVDLALPMIVILLVQATVMAIWAYWITFRSMGKDYEAAVMAAGHCGVGLGQTPNALANMKVVIEKHGAAPNAWFVLPVITVIFINICNPIIISFFIDYFK